MYTTIKTIVSFNIPGDECALRKFEAEVDLANWSKTSTSGVVSYEHTRTFAHVDSASE